MFCNTVLCILLLCLFFFLFSFSHFCFPASGQAVVTGVVLSPPRFLPSSFIAHRFQQSHCSSIFRRVLLTHALALSASQLVHKIKSPNDFFRVCTRGDSNSRTDPYQRLEDSLIRHRGDHLYRKAKGIFIVLHLFLLSKTVFLVGYRESSS